MRQWRKRSIPVKIEEDAFRLYSQEYRILRVASRLAELGVWTTKGSVEGLIKGDPPLSSMRPAA